MKVEKYLMFLLILLGIFVRYIFYFFTFSLQSYQHLWITLWIIFYERMILMAIEKEDLVAKIKEVLQWNL